MREFVIKALRNYGYRFLENARGPSSEPRREVRLRGECPHRLKAIL